MYGNVVAHCSSRHNTGLFHTGDQPGAEYPTRKSQNRFTATVFMSAQTHHPLVLARQLGDGFYFSTTETGSTSADSMISQAYREGARRRNDGMK